MNKRSLIFLTILALLIGCSQSSETKVSTSAATTNKITATADPKISLESEPVTTSTETDELEGGGTKISTSQSGAGVTVESTTQLQSTVEQRMESDGTL